MPDPIADYNTAADGFAAVLNGCGDELSGQSPCEGWNAKDVIDHVLNGATYYVGAFGGQAPEIEGDPATRYAALRAAIVETVGAVQASGVLDEPVMTPVGMEMPGGRLFGIFTTDTLLHTWDLARATGQDVELDAELLERSWQNMLPLDEVIRRPGVFGPKVDVGDDAPRAVQALAFFGRDAR